MWDFLKKEPQENIEKENNKGQESCHIGAGQPCPRCRQGKLDYNSLLNLACPVCGYELSASFT